MGRSPCCEKVHTNKGAWTKEEDDKLKGYIRAHGEGCWRSLPKEAGLLRCGKSCRLRWINYLRPDLKRGNFTEEEDDTIIKLHSLFGNKWSLIAGRLPGRTDNEIKNYWNTHIRRKLLARGVNPASHTSLSKAPAKAASLPGTPDEKSRNSFSTSTTTEETKFSPGIKASDAELNLELRISLPYQNHRHQHTKVCFSCSLGVKNNKDCSCTFSNGARKAVAGLSFLREECGVLDFREMDTK